MHSEPLPDFLKPPVKETVIGFYFTPLKKLQSTHLGAFWDRQLRTDWPDVTDAHALPPQIERFGDASVLGSSFGISLSDQPAVRVQIRNSTKDRMLQIQNGQFHYNWIGHSGAEYARYPKLRSEFNDTLNEWAYNPGAIDDEGAAPSPNVIRHALKAAQKLHHLGNPAPVRIIATVNGEIAFEWEGPSILESLTFHLDGSVDRKFFQSGRLVCSEPVQ